MGEAERLLEEEWVVIKRDLYYRPDDSGYTGILDNAGRYSKEEACKRVGDGNRGITMMLAADAPEFTDACFDDLARAHLQKQRDEARARAETANRRTKKEKQRSAAANRARALAEAQVIGLRQARDEARKLNATLTARAEAAEARAATARVDALEEAARVCDISKTAWMLEAGYSRDEEGKWKGTCTAYEDGGRKHNRCVHRSNEALDLASTIRSLSTDTSLVREEEGS